MKYKVLVAEDELIERMVLCKTLRKHLGELCDIFESKNGREALEVFDREQPQIAILDIEMPGINGLEVARKIRESGKDCAILFLTGFDKFSYAKQAISVRALEYLLNKYKNFVRTKARSYFLIGADHEDIVQEGMIGLYKAIRDFREDRLSSFRAFAELCITRQIITAIKTATRQKHVPLNSYVSLNKPIYEEESDRTLMDVITEGRSADPEELIIGQESYVSIESQIDEALSPLERKVLAAYLDGKSYQEIAANLDRHVKSIDNALQRVKHKLEKLIRERNH